MAKTIIDAHNVSKTFNPKTIPVHAVQNVHVHIEEGEFVALVGPSGSGKSTLLNMMGGLDEPTAGSVIIDGVEITELSENKLIDFRLHNIGFVFQSFNLLPRTSALENVALPLVYAGVAKKERLERAQAVLEKVGLGDRGDHKPNELSGGQRQRVAIARALINNPSIVLADEPTGNLDSKSSAEIMHLFQAIHDEGNTVVMVTHEEDIAQYAKRTIRMRDGKLASQLSVI